MKVLVKMEVISEEQMEVPLRFSGTTKLLVFCMSPFPGATMYIKAHGYTIKFYLPEDPSNFSIGVSEVHIRNVQIGIITDKNKDLFDTPQKFLAALSSVHNEFLEESNLEEFAKKLQEQES